MCDQHVGKNNFYSGSVIETSRDFDCNFRIGIQISAKLYYNSINGFCV